MRPAVDREEAGRSAATAGPAGAIVPPDAAALGRQEERFRALFTDGPAPQAFADIDGRLAAANAAYLRLLGRSHADIIGRSLLELTHPDDREENVRLLDDLVAGRIGTFQIAKRYLHADGHPVPVLNTVAIVESGGARYVAAVALPRPLTAGGGDLHHCEHEARWRAAFHDSALPQAYADAAGVIADVNTALCDLLGLAATELVRRPPGDLSHQTDPGDADRALRRLLAGETSATTSERVLRHASGRPIPVLVFANAVVGGGVVDGFVAYYQDLRLIEDAERRLDQQRQMFAALGERSQDVGVVTDAEGTLVHVSPAVRSIFGHEPHDVVGRVAWDFVHPDDLGALRTEFDDLVASHGGTRVRTIRVFASDGGIRWSTVTMTNLLDTPVGGVVANLVDVTDQRAVEARFRLEQQRNQAIVDSLQEGLWVTDPAGSTVFANDTLADILGVPLTTIYGVTAMQLLSGEARELAAERLRTRVVRGPERYEILYEHPDGGMRQLQMSAVPMAFGDDPVTGSLATVNDVTTARAMERELRHASLHDPLTGLPNRALLMDRLEHALQRADATISVLLVDLDQFKLVNDARGHEVGDRVLVEVASRLRDIAGAGDTVARLGGDEFVIVCESDATDAAAEIASTVQHAVQSPIVLDEHEVRVTASIGIASQAATTASDLLRYADAAMSAAKRSGRARARVFDRKLAEEAENAYALAADLQSAVLSNALDAHYQPVIELATGAITSYEMLARWTHPDQGPIAPSLFIPLAERSGLASAIDRWAIRRGIADAGALRASGAIAPTAHIAINLSARHLSDSDLEEVIVDATRRAEVPPRQLTFEITEGAIMHDVTASLRLLSRLRDRGYQVALDDFGTGHSSLAYLRDLPITTLKVDRSFIADMTQDEDAMAIVTSIIQLARAVGATTVAEGVETAAQADELRLRGCVAAQGWLWSKAVPVAEIRQLPRAFDAAGLRQRRAAHSRRRPAVAEEHGLVRLLEMQRQGASLATIAAALNSEGYRAPNGARWHRLTVARALADLGPLPHPPATR